MYVTYTVCEEVAKDIHKGQTRKFGQDKGKPYFIHPSRVADNFADYGDACVAILHDCIEDYDYRTLKDSQTVDSIYLAKGYLLMRGVPNDIVKDVELLSKKEGETYYDFILRVLKSERAIRVKIADIEDNLQSLEEGNLKQKYLLALHVLKSELKLKKQKK